MTAYPGLAQDALQLLYLYGNSGHQRANQPWPNQQC